MRTERGFTIIELSVATAITVFVALSLFQVLLAEFSTEKQLNAAATRTLIVSQIRKSIMERNSARETVRRTSGLFHDCVCGTGTCSSLKSASALQMFDGSGEVISPRSYNADGSFCEPNSKDDNCLFKVTTAATAQCAPNLALGQVDPPANCNGVPADLVRISYTVAQNTKMASKLNLPRTRDISGGVFLQPSDLNISPASGECL